MLARLTKTLIPLPVHPLYLFTLALALGVVWQSTSTALLHQIFVAIVTFALLFVSLKKRHYTAILLTSMALFFVGALRYQQQVDTFHEFYRSIGRRPVTISARVIDCEPSYRQEGTFIATLEINSCCTCFPKNRKPIKTYQQSRDITNNNVAVGKKICITVSGTPLFEVGDTVYLERIFFFPPNDKSDYTKYLIKSGLVAYLRSHPEKIVVTHHPQKSLRRAISTLRNTILESAKKRLSPQTFALFTSIFWGKHAVDQRQLNNIREHFRPWGILHYLARAGLHVTMLIILLEKMISFLPLPFMVRTVLGATLIGGYALLTWSSISFLRAIIVFAILILCTLLWTPSHGLYRLTLACFLILVWNPSQLFFLDFQLSFLVTAVFMWMSAITKEQNS